MQEFPKTCFTNSSRGFDSLSNQFSRLAPRNATDMIEVCVHHQQRFRWFIATNNWLTINQSNNRTNTMTCSIYQLMIKRNETRSAKQTPSFRANLTFLIQPNRFTVMRFVTFIVPEYRTTLSPELISVIDFFFLKKKSLKSKTTNKIPIRITFSC